MANARRRRFSGPRRMTDWIGGVTTNDIFTTLAGSGISIHASFDTRLVATPDAPFTVVRIRGLFMAQSDQIAVDEEFFGAIGICKVNGEAFDAGAASVPDPFDESFDDRWLYQRYFAGNILQSGGAATTQTVANFAVDSKAMRKFEHGDVLIFVIRNRGTTGIQFFWNQRVLVKVH